MWRERTGFQLGVELHADEPGMVVIFDDFREEPVGRHAAKAHAMLRQPVLVAGVDLIAMAVALGNFAGLINVGDAAAALEDGRIGAEPHGAAEIAGDAALL